MDIATVKEWIALLKVDLCWVFLILGTVWHVKQELSNRALINSLVKPMTGQSGGKNR